MRVFRSHRDIDNNGREWAPTVSFTCPHCTVTNKCYVQLRDNRCTYCKKVMPFPSGMCEKTSLRVAYHVDTETESDTCEQIDVHPMLVREGD